jgi:formylglycine-generating enzyme required for sulfatase activity/nitrate/TMAO reductase-like tetraheme cytochrome c subunit
MRKLGKKGRWKRIAGLICAAGAASMVVMMGLNYAWVNSSKDDSCMACHVHPDSEESWRMSKHYMNGSGTKTSCADCHLPPSGSPEYVVAKATTGLKDIWSYLFKDTENIDWDAKGEMENARKIVYNASCIECHHQLFPEGISDDGVTAHLYWEGNAENLDLNCIDCHLDAGHYNPNYTHAKMTGVPVREASGPIFEETTPVSSFADFEEHIPGTRVAFNMKAIPAGSFMIGSPDNEPLRAANEGPQKETSVGRFFMAETETTWDMFWQFYSETMTEGRTPFEVVNRRNENPEVDGFSGPTPPFGNPEQEWGGGRRPAITMSYYAADIFCRWLSAKTGKKYRLPTEAEWEWAARGGTDTPYFFEGSPRKYSDQGMWNKMFGADTTVINTYTIYVHNSKNRTQEPSNVKANPYGLKNMTGNVWEYTTDWYEGDGIDSETERVIRGGGYADDAAGVRSAVRGPTQTEMWLRTDPQQPKSVWWLSDMRAIGFRVVMEVPEGI